MNKEIIAQIKLSAGQAGYYDEYSNIHLTCANPIANVYAGTNCSNIKRAVASGKLQLVFGTFSLPVKQKPEIHKPISKSVNKKETEPAQEISVGELEINIAAAEVINTEEPANIKSKRHKKKQGRETEQPETEKVEEAKPDVQELLPDGNNKFC